MKPKARAVAAIAVRFFKALAAGDDGAWRSLGNWGGFVVGVLFILVRGVLDASTLIFALLIGLCLKFAVQEAPQLLRRLHLRSRASARPSMHLSREVESFRVALARLAERGGAPASTMARELLRNVDTVAAEWGRSPRTEELAIGNSDRLAEILAKTWRGQVSEKRTLDFRERVKSAKAALDVNTPHALVFDEDIDETSNVFRYYPTRYATLCALLQMIAEEGCEAAVSIPRVLGAGGLVVCAEAQEVVFLRRASAKTMHPGKLHVFGGNLEPNPREQGELGRDADLQHNAKREIHEECGFLPSTLGGTLVLSHTESADPTIQEDVASDGERWKSLMRNLPVHFCGVNVSTVDLDRMSSHHTAEGVPEFIHVKNLEGELHNVSQWVPAGWYTTMLWLWMGAPSQGVDAAIAAGEARAMAARILGLAQPPEE